MSNTGNVQAPPSASDIELLLTALKRDDLPGATRFPGGYPGEIELALLDAILSIRARYGDWPRTGVGKRVMAYKTARGVDTCDDLDTLASFPSDTLLEICGSQKTGRRLKSDAIIAAARALVAAGVRHSHDLAKPDEQHRRAYVSVNGLGEVTWSYLLMLLGHSDVKPDRMIMRYLRRAGLTVTPEQARTIVVATAGELNISASDLDHAIWRFERSHGGKQ
ncbi:hypothetical protein [Calidifontibacter indicus]|uniref:hypothetical protein n=1 Tax=Calidifontibacter indicus TaxID=419650 RepID=UPI003D70A493